MKSKIKFQSCISKDSVNFLDVTVRISKNRIVTSVYSKPTDAHLYLHKKSCHPHHVIKNIPKGQFIRVRRICSNIEDFNVHAETMKKNFVARGYDPRNLDQVIKIVRKMNRKDLLQDKLRPTKEGNSVLVCTWHPKLRNMSSILKENYNILNADIKLNKIFKERSTVAFRKNRTLGNQLCRNDIKKKKEDQMDEKCTGCKLCRIIGKRDTLINPQNGAKVEVKPGSSCKTIGIIYAVHCKKCKQIYIGHTGESMSKRWSKHKYDIINRPLQNELATHCHKDHDLEKDLEVHILDHGITLLAERERMEDKFICMLQTHQRRLKFRSSSIW